MQHGPALYHIVVGRAHQQLMATNGELVQEHQAAWEWWRLAREPAGRCRSQGMAVLAERCCPKVVEAESFGAMLVNAEAADRSAWKLTRAAAGGIGAVTLPHETIWKPAQQPPSHLRQPVAWP